MDTGRFMAPALLLVLFLISKRKTKNSFSHFILADLIQVKGSLVRHLLVKIVIIKIRPDVRTIFNAAVSTDFLKKILPNVTTVKTIKQNKTKRLEN